MRSLSVVYLKVELVSETCDSEFHAYAIIRQILYIYFMWPWLVANIMHALIG